MLPHSLIGIMNKSLETMVFSGCQKLTEARIVMVDFKFVDTGKSFREPPVVGLVEKFVLVGGAVCANHT